MAWGTLTSIGTASQNGSSTTSITVPAGGVPAGALIVVAVCESNVTTTGIGSVTDTHPNTYVSPSGASGALNGANASGWAGIFYAYNVSALVSGNTITWTAGTTGGACAMSAFYVTGELTSSAPLDTAVTNSAHGSSTHPSVTSGSTSNTNDLFVGVVGWNGGSGPTTLSVQDSTHAAYQNFPVAISAIFSGCTGGGAFVNTSSGSLAYAPTLSTSSTWWAGIVGFQIAASGVSVTPAAGSLALSGVAPTVTQNAALSPSAGSLALSGAAPSVVQNAALTPTAGSLALTGVAPTVAATANFALTPSAGALALSGVAPSVVQNAQISPAAASLALSGVAPSAVQNAAITPAATSLVLSGVAPSVVQNAALSPIAGSLALSGIAPSIVQNAQATPAAASLTLSGVAPALTQNAASSPTAGSLALAGVAPTVALTANFALTPTAGALALSSTAPTVSLSSANNISPTAGSIALTGATPTVALTTNVGVAPSAGTIALTGSIPTVATSGSVSVSPTAASLALTGSVPVVVVASQGASIMPPSAALMLSGGTPIVVQTTTPPPPNFTIGAFRRNQNGSSSLEYGIQMVRVGEMVQWSATVGQPIAGATLYVAFTALSGPALTTVPLQQEGSSWVGRWVAKAVPQTLIAWSIQPTGYANSASGTLLVYTQPQGNGGSVL